MISTPLVLFGFAVVSTSFLSGSFHHVAAQSAAEAVATSEPNLQEPAPPSEPASEEPALQLNLDSAGVDVVPTPPRTADGCTLDEMVVRVWRPRSGLKGSVVALGLGGVIFGISFVDACSFLGGAVPNRVGTVQFALPVGF